MASKKIALVTGGSSGIGAAAARRLAKDDLHVVVLASTSIEKAEGVVNDIKNDGGQATPMICNVRAVDSIKATVRKIADDLGDIDVLVNSAGLFYPTTIGECGGEDFEQMADVNLRGTFFFINEVVPGMKRRERGKIVNIASVAAVMGIANYSLYCATKAAIQMLTKSLACDLAPFGININAVSPGNTATPINEALRTDPAYNDYLAGMYKATLSRTKFSAPEDIAEIIAFLSSDKARSMHGATILADEGISAGF